MLNLLDSLSPTATFFSFGFITLQTNPIYQFFSLGSSSTFFAVFLFLMIPMGLLLHSLRLPWPICFLWSYFVILPARGLLFLPFRLNSFYFAIFFPHIFSYCWVSSAIGLFCQKWASTISNSNSILSSQTLSSLMAQTQALSLLSWLKTHGQTPLLKTQRPIAETHAYYLSLSLSLSLFLSWALSLLSWSIHLMAEDLWLNPMVEDPETQTQDRLKEIRYEIDEDWLVFWYFWFCVLIWLWFGF